jgi:site-specific DNA-methyltransferase (adenine-specific)
MVHCDWRTSHRQRVLLDEIFGEENFRNEIIWHYRRWTAAANTLQRLHQTILYYAVSQRHVPDVPLVAYSPTTNLDQIWQARSRNADNVSVYQLELGEPVNSGAKRGVPLGDVWDLPYLNPKARERVGYPTQKPLALLEQLILLACPASGLVIDPCCGSGTTLVAAKLLGRSFIGIDIAPEAVQLAKSRLENPVRSDSAVVRNGRKSFERSADQTPVLTVLALLGAHVVHRNTLIDGYLSPEGLRVLGLRSDLSVPVKVDLLGDAELEARFRQVVRKKGSEIGLLVVPGAAVTFNDRVAKIPPPTPEDVTELRLRVRHLVQASPHVAA